MTPKERKDGLSRMAECVDRLAKVMAENARAIGVEWSTSDAEDVIRKGFKEAQKQAMTRMFLRMLNPLDHEE